MGEDDGYDYSSDSDSGIYRPVISRLEAKMPQFVSIAPEELSHLMHSVINEVAELLNISEDVAVVLLLYFNWNKEKLLDKYCVDPTEVCFNAGAPNPDCADIPCGIGNGMLNIHLVEKSEPFLCPISYDVVPLSMSFSMNCDVQGETHRASIEAWRKYLLNALENNSSACVRSKCPFDNCRTVVPPKVWMTIFGQTSQLILKKYDRFLVSSFLEMNKSIRWCPGPDCTWAVRSTMGRVFSVKCASCRCHFCFQCSEIAHQPLSCSEFVTWKEKCEGESETVKWVSVNTKKCPKCSTRIEKNSGCNHMHCTVCSSDFCWICLGYWNIHGQNTGGNYECNRFKENATSSTAREVANCKMELERFIHYYTRFQTHQTSLKFANKQREMVVERMNRKQESDSTWINRHFILDTFEQLVECRRVLMYTYALAYQMSDGPRKELLQYNQGMLEKNTERLSELSEMNLDLIDVSECINYTRVTENFVKRLLDHILEPSDEYSNGSTIDT